MCLGEDCYFWFLDLNESLVCLWVCDIFLSMSYLSLSLEEPEKFECEGGFDKSSLHITLFHFPWDDRMVAKELMRIVRANFSPLKCNRMALGGAVNYFGKDNKFVVLEVESKWIYEFREKIAKKLRENMIVYSTNWPFSAHITLGKKDEVNIYDCLTLQNLSIVVNDIEMHNRLEMLDSIKL